MQTSLASFIRDTPDGQEANAILRNCVHCGFCNAVCPTYRLLGDERDGPRGRIYLVKQVLEGARPTERSRTHLDRCLTCRACETACPSGVDYHRLADIGRGIVERQAPRPWPQRLLRRSLRAVLAHARRFGPLYAVARALRPLLPGRLRHHVPERRPAGAWPRPRHARRMLILDGCVQPAMAPRINAATARVLDAAGISLIRADGAGCCGALSHHLAAHEEARDFMRRNVDAWWPHVQDGAEAIVSTATGCGAMLVEYAHLLRDDPAYAERAARIVTLIRDVGEVLAGLEPPRRATSGIRVALHAPCTQQHALGVHERPAAILEHAGFTLTAAADPEQCCGSAGTYSLLQRRLALELRDKKLDALQAGEPDVIATANIGCLAHLQSGTGTPVRHWIELLDDLYAEGGKA